TGPASRMDAGPAGQGIDREAGIVRQRRPVGAARGSERLEAGLAGKVAFGLRWPGEPERAGRQRLGAPRPPQIGDLAQLALVVAAENQPRTAFEGAGHQATAVCCRITSSSIPWRARRMSSLKLSGENGLPSAVPWTSTMPPLPVMTKLASVSA